MNNPHPASPLSGGGVCGSLTKGGLRACSLPWQGRIKSMLPPLARGGFRAYSLPWQGRIQSMLPPLTRGGFRACSLPWQGEGWGWSE